MKMRCCTHLVAGLPRGGFGSLSGPGSAAPSSPLAPQAPLYRRKRQATTAGSRPWLRARQPANNELGWKTMWRDRRIQWNGAIYQEDWNNAQVNVAVIGLIGSVILNGGNYRVRGMETSVVARVTDGLTFEGGAAWNRSELVKQTAFRWRDGTPIDFTSLKTSTGRTLSNPGGALGSPLAGAPPFQANIRARYEFAFNGYDAFAQLDAVHRASLKATDRMALARSRAYSILPICRLHGLSGALGFRKGRVARATLRREPDRHAGATLCELLSVVQSSHCEPFPHHRFALLLRLQVGQTGARSTRSTGLHCCH